jgi:hypothetical protein
MTQRHHRETKRRSALQAGQAAAPKLSKRPPTPAVGRLPPQALSMTAHLELNQSGEICRIGVKRWIGAEPSVTFRIKTCARISSPPSSVSRASAGMLLVHSQL